MNTPFVGMDESQARQSILDLVAAYYEAYKKPEEGFVKGQRLPYASRMFGAREMQNLVDSSLEFWLTSGRWTDEFEKNFAAFLGVKTSLLVNSGSSANLLAFMALTSPLLPEEKRVMRGDEVITAAAGFPTTVAPIVQYGAVPVFVDVTIPQYNLDATLLERAWSPKTKAVFLAHTLGNPFDIAAIKRFCDAHGLWLVEDNCDALGSRYTLDGQERYTGTFGHIGTSSFYPPHHMTMGEGGAVYTNDPLLAKILRALRDWGRDCVCPSGVDGLCGHRFDRQYGELPLGYDHKYVYSHFGYNLKATDMQAAIGVAQLGRLPEFTAARRRNFERLAEALGPAGNKLVLPEACPNAKPSWFGYLMTCREGNWRGKIIEALEQAGIQTRMLFAGNLVKHPCFDEMRATGQGYRVVGQLENTDRIMKDSFWVGVYPGLSEEKIDYIAEMILAALP